MFGYSCILICLILARNSRPEYKFIAYVLLAEFVAHKLIYLICDQLMNIPGSFLYTLYIVAELTAIIYIQIYQSHRIITAFILFTILYNVLVVSQYSMPVYDYVENYGLIMGIVMLLELAYLGMLTKYVANFRRKHGFISVGHIDSMFSIRRRNLDRLYTKRADR